MPNLATWLKIDSEPISSADRRLANRFLRYWEGLRGHHDLPLITDLNLDDMGEFVPYAFNLDLSDGTDNPKFRFIGWELLRDCGGDATNQGVSQLMPQSLLARVIRHRGKVIADGKPCGFADEFINAEGHQVLYRAIMLPFSGSGDQIDFIVGAVSSKTVEQSAATGAAPHGVEGANDGPAQVPARGRETPQDLAQNRFAPQNRKEVRDLIADVSVAMCDEPPARPAATEPNRVPSAVMARQGGGADGGRVIVVGSEKGGTGKSTTAMHLIVSLLYAGHRVGSMDLDSPQWSLSRYLENRQSLNRKRKLNLPCPEHVGSSDPDKESGLFEDDLNRLVNACDFVVIDTPGSDTAISRMAHSWADIVITPINDSFMDLDTLAVLDPDGQQIRRRGHYANMIAHARKQKIARTGEGFDWVVLRNRLSNLDARNKQHMADALNSLASYLDFRNCAGLSERVIFRELFLRGLTLLDLREQSSGVTLSVSHLAARQELRALLQAIGISEAAGAKQSQVAVG